MLIYLSSAGQWILINTWYINIKGFVCGFVFLCLNLFLSTEGRNYHGLSLFFHRKKTVFVTNLQYHHMRREEKRGAVIQQEKINTIIQKLQNYNFHKQVEHYLKLTTNSVILVHHPNTFVLPLLPKSHGTLESTHITST